MKSIINEIKYDTNSATLLETINHTLQLLNGSVSAYTNTVYQAASGEYFPHTKTDDDEYILPLTPEEADKYLHIWDAL